MLYYRTLFTLAASYNLAFGLWGGLDPGGLARAFDLPAMNYPSIWACLAMVVGLYGVLYGYVAWKPEEGDLIIAVGLAGKIFGPLGWMATVDAGELPPRTLPLILFNDLLWWYPFAAYLLRRTLWQRPAIVLLSVAFHVVACVGILIAGRGTELEPDVATRHAFVASHVGLWAGVWVAWILSSLGLLATCVLWAQGLFERTADRSWRTIAAAACAVVGFGLACDLTGEWILIARATLPGNSAEDFAAWQRSYQILSAGIGNGLYCVGGLMLSAVSWRMGWLTGWMGSLGVVLWCVGLGLSCAAFWPSDAWMTVLGAAVMLLFLPFATWLAVELVPRQAETARAALDAD